VAPSPVAPATRAAVIAASSRIPIATDSLQGSIALKGGRIDDLALVKFRETVDPKSPPIFLLSPTGTADPFYAEFGWTNAAGANVKVPTADTAWTQASSGALGVGHPVTLTYDNGEGLQFRRTIAVDDKYLFTIKDEVINNSAAPVTLYPFGLISRHGTPQTLGYYILHEGLIGVFGDKGLQEETYTDIEKKKEVFFSATDVWLGITDKYWATTLLPDTNAQVAAKFSTGTIGNNIKTYQSDYLGPAQTIAPGGAAAVNGRLFAGAKEVEVVDNYDKQLKLNRFELLIDWGWFYYITKNLFRVIDWIYHFTGNFGWSILIVTLLLKLLLRRQKKKQGRP